MFAWITIDFDTQSLERLVRFSQHNLDRHAVKLLNISTAQLHGSQPNQPANVVYTSRNLLLLTKALRGLDQCEALRLTGHPSSWLQRQLRLLPTSVSRDLRPCTSDQQFGILSNTLMRAVQSSGREISLLMIQDEGILDHHQIETGLLAFDVFDSIQPTLLGLAFHQLTCVDFSQSHLPIRVPVGWSASDAGHFPAPQFLEFLHHLPILEALSVSMPDTHDLISDHERQPIAEVWQLLDIPLLKRFELRGAFVEYDYFAGCLRRHLSTLRCVTLSHIAMKEPGDWADFAEMMLGMDLRKVVIDFPYELSVHNFVPLQTTPPGIRTFALEGDIDAALVRFSQQLA